MEKELELSPRIWREFFSDLRFVPDMYIICNNDSVSMGIFYWNKPNLHVQQQHESHFIIPSLKITNNLI